MPKVKLTDNATGEVAVVDWTGDKPPSQAEARSLITQQLESRVAAHESIAAERQKLTFAQRAVSASPESPFLERAAGAVMNVIPPVQEALTGVASMFDPKTWYEGGKQAVRGISQVGKPLQGPWQGPVRPEISIMPEIQHQASALADVAEGIMTAATPVMAAFGAVNPVQALRAVVPFMGVDYGIKKGVEALGGDPTSGLSRVAALAGGFAAGEIGLRKGEPKIAAPPEASFTGANKVTPRPVKARPVARPKPVPGPLQRPPEIPGPEISPLYEPPPAKLVTPAIIPKIEPEMVDTTAPTTVQQPLASDVVSPAPQVEVSTALPQVAPPQSIAQRALAKVRKKGKQPVKETLLEATPVTSGEEGIRGAVAPQVPSSTQVHHEPTTGSRVFQHPDGTFTAEVLGDIKGTFKTQEEAVRSLSAQLPSKVEEPSVETSLPKETTAQKALARVKRKAEPIVPEKPIEEVKFGAIEKPIEPKVAVATSEHKVGDIIQGKAGTYEVDAVTPESVNYTFTSKGGRTTFAKMSPMEFSNLKKKSGGVVEKTPAEKQLDIAREEDNVPAITRAQKEVKKIGKVGPIRPPFSAGKVGKPGERGSFSQKTTNKRREPEYALTSEGKVKLGADVRSLGTILGSSLYSRGGPQVVAKELLQNAYDAIRKVPGGKGEVKAHVDRSNRTITIEDNGPGMTREEVGSVFTDLGASGKRGEESASGGFGLAKAAPLMMSEKIHLVTIADTPDGRFRTTMEATPEDLLGEGVNIKHEQVGKDIATGTRVEVTMPSKYSSYDLGFATHEIKKSKRSMRAPGKLVGTQTGHFATDHSWSWNDRPMSSDITEDFSPLDRPIYKGRIENAADIEIIASKTKDPTLSGRQSAEVEINNNGIYQFTHTISTGASKAKGIPTRMAVDIKSLVPEGHPEYPFTANRESLRGKTLATIDQIIKEEVINPAVNEARNYLQKQYDNMPSLTLATGKKIPFHDAGERLTSAEKAILKTNKDFQHLAATIVRVAEDARDVAKTSELLGTYSKTGEGVERIGLIFSDKVYGVHVPNPSSSPRVSTVLLDPFHFQETSQPSQIASLYWQTIKHELLHDKVSNHYDSFTTGEVKLSEALGHLDLTSLEALRDAYSGETSTLRPGVADALRVYKESRGRAENAPDLFGGEESRTERSSTGQYSKTKDIEGLRSSKKPAVETSRAGPVGKPGERGSFRIESKKEPKRQFLGEGAWIFPNKDVVPIERAASHENLWGKTGKPPEQLITEGIVRTRGNGIEYSINANPETIRQAARYAGRSTPELYVDIHTPSGIRSRVYDTAELKENNWNLSQTRPIESLERGSLPIDRPKKDKLPSVGPIKRSHKAQDPLRTVLDALKEAKPLRESLEATRSIEKGERLARTTSVSKRGEAGYYAERGQLKGEYTKAHFESLRNKIGQKHIDSLFNLVKDSHYLTDWEKISAREGLAKLFGEFGGEVPQRSQLSLLERAFSGVPGASARVTMGRTIAEFPRSKNLGTQAEKEALAKDFVKTLMDKRDLWTKSKELGIEIANIPKAVMASTDLSAPLRQGLFLIGRPKQFIPAFVQMFKDFGSEKAFKANQEVIRESPHYDLMERSKLALTEMSGDLNTREEAFIGAQLVEKVPLAGRVIRASNRAYTGFLNKLRADVFSTMMDKANKLGYKPNENVDFTQKVADYINTATGRGRLPLNLEKVATDLNVAIFSPRLVASRIRLLTKALNPTFYMKENAFVRKEYLRDLLSTTAFVTSVLSLAHMAGADVGLDPRSSDFAKIKVGNTRIDVGGGFLPYITLAARLLTNKTITGKGKITKLGEGYKPTTRLSLIGRFGETKESPSVSLASDLLRGTTIMGEKTNIPKAIGSRFVPMVVQDFYDLVKDDPSLLLMGVPGIFGAGVQTYTTKSSGRSLPSVHRPLRP